MSSILLPSKYQIKFTLYPTLSTKPTLTTYFRLLNSNFNYSIKFTSLLKIIMIPDITIFNFSLNLKNVVTAYPHWNSISIAIFRLFVGYYYFFLNITNIYLNYIIIPKYYFPSLSSNGTAWMNKASLSKLYITYDFLSLLLNDWLFHNKIKINIIIEKEWIIPYV